jgi:sugar-specific transcriptional regulator TrmB
MIESLFTILGISKTETRIYIALADLGKAPASLLAKKLELPRSSVYTCLDNLEKNGLVLKQTLNDIAMYQSKSVDAISEMIHREKTKSEKSIKEKEDASKELIPLLESHFKNKNFSIPRLEFFEGSDGIERMLYKYEKIWQQSITHYDFTWWGYQDPHFVEIYRVWLDRYWASMLEQEKINLFSNKSEIESKLSRKIARRSIKKVDKKTEFSSTIWVLGDYVVTIMTRQQPHYAFILHDSVFAANQRMVFQKLWNSTK